MKKVALLFSISYKAPNGASRFVHTFVDKKDFFANKQIDFHVYAPDVFQECDFSQNNRSRNRKHIIKKYLFKIFNNSSLLTILYDYFVEARTARIIVNNYLKQNFNDNLVHCQEDQTAYYLLKKKKNIKIIHTFHNDGKDYEIYYASRPALNSWLGRKYLSNRYDYIIKNADKLGFVSKRSMDIFCQRHPEVVNKTFYVYNGIADAPLRHQYSNSNENIITFICVASINENKNQRSIIEAVRIIPDDMRSRIELLIVGDGEERKNLEMMSNDYNLTNVLFMGNCNNVTELLAKSDVFILVSKSEGLPISVIEAMREGLPIIGSNAGGIPELVINGVNGFVTETDPSNIAHSMLRMIEMGAHIRSEYGNKSYEFFKEKFSDQVMFNSYAEVYYKLLNGS